MRRVLAGLRRQTTRGSAEVFWARRFGFLQSEAHGAGETRNRFFVALIKTWRGWDLPVPVKANPEPIFFRVLNKKHGEAGICLYPQGQTRNKSFSGSKIKTWRGWDLNPEPMAYESTAPPLSYLAQCAKILPDSDQNVNRKLFFPVHNPAY